jgi:plastocyanin
MSIFAKKLSFLLVIGFIAGAVQAAEYEVSQKDKKFTVTSLKLKVGDTIKFTNEDAFPHNVYSLSDIQTFDLGSHGQGAVKTVKFDKAGVIEVECAIHHSMKLKVEVQ